jgi:hypothetical protein
MTTALLPSSTDDFDQLLARACADGVLEGVRVIAKPTEDDPWWRARRILCALEGTLVVDSRRVPLRIGLTASFPLELPEIALVVPHSFGDLPHVEKDGKLCFQSEEGLELDRRNPLGILRASVTRAEATLRECFDGSRADAFLDELGAYWLLLAVRPAVTTMVAPGDEPRLLQIMGAGTSVDRIVDTPDEQTAYHPTRMRADVPLRSALYVPVDFAANDNEFRPASLLSISWLRAQLDAGRSRTQRKEFKRLLRHCEKDVEYLVLGVRRGRGDRVLLGLRLSQMRGGHPLSPAPRVPKAPPPAEPTAVAEAVRLVRLDRGYLLPRGGASASLAERKVLLAGCGAVGGHLAMLLASAGVGELVLVDHDSFAPENTFRHACGRTQQGKPKVQGLKEEIERRYPYVRVRAVRDSIRAALGVSSVMESVDLVVCAMGKPALELEVNERVRAAGGPPLLFTWLEPLGLGGHAVLTNLPADTDRKGCLECLYMPTDDVPPPCNRLALAPAGVFYGRDELGCGAHYTTFSNLDATRSAEVAARLALEALTGEVHTSACATWRGNDRAFRAAGHKPTDRFATLGAEERLDGSLFHHAGCPVCSPANP